VAGQLTVRKAEPQDRAGFDALWQAWQRHMGGRVPADATERSWQRIASADPGLCCLMAFADGEASGFAMVSRTYFAWTGSDILYLQDLFVSPEARGQRIGEALLLAVYRLADETGAAQVFWIADRRDARLQAFYDRHALSTPYIRYVRSEWPW
jgi:GNAT superfamily N-acetyltransferase